MMPAWMKPSCWVSSRLNGNATSTTPGDTTVSVAPSKAIAGWRPKFVRTSSGETRSMALVDRQGVRVLARRRERQVRPALLRQLQVDPRRGQVDQLAGGVDRQV